MRFLWFVIISLFSGIVAGMGMGGGTVLIPLLTIFMNVNQQVAQAINLLVFVPLAIVVLIIYFKKGLIKLNGIWWLVVPAILVSALGSIVSVKLSSHLVSIIFGVFLILVGVFMLITNIISQTKNSK